MGGGEGLYCWGYVSWGRFIYNVLRERPFPGRRGGGDLIGKVSKPLVRGFILPPQCYTHYISKQSAIVGPLRLLLRKYKFVVSLSCAYKGERDTLVYIE